MQVAEWPGCRNWSTEGHQGDISAGKAIVVEEVDESELWLDILDERNVGTEALRKTLLAESREFRAIFVQACMTARPRERKKRSFLTAVP